MIIGQPPPLRLAVSRISSAPAPYIGPSISRNGNWVSGMLPSTHSPTKGLKTNSARASTQPRRLPPELLERILYYYTMARTVNPEIHARRRAAIIEAAAVEFARNGIDGTS